MQLCWEQLCPRDGIQPPLLASCWESMFCGNFSPVSYLADAGAFTLLQREREESPHCCFFSSSKPGRTVTTCLGQLGRRDVCSSWRKCCPLPPQLHSLTRAGVKETRKHPRNQQGGWGARETPEIARAPVLFHISVRAPLPTLRGSSTV